MPRPLYSLLALLLFTAAVAGGVKLWRGPYRAVMSDPPTVEEQLFLVRATMAEFHFEYFKPVRYEYDFHRTWQGKVCSVVLGRPAGSEPIRVLESSDPTRTVLDRSHIHSLDAAPATSSATEHIVCWAHSCQPKDSESGFILAYQPLTILAGKQEAYYLSNQGRLFVDTPIPMLGIYVRPIVLAEVNDPEVRARLAEELAKLSN
jgi:hypothetical protein